MKSKIFVVPHDFSNVADIALNHAISTAENIKAEIILLHVVSKAKEIEHAEKQLNEIINKQNTNVKLIPNVRMGNIFEDIGDFAAEKHAELIFMGTHGIQGWQHLTGSNALKVISNSNVPFVIVQEKAKQDSTYKNIIVPLDLNKETKQKLAVVADLAAYFQSKVHLITPDETDDFLKRQINANIAFANTFFEQRNIEVTTKLAPTNSFDKEVVKLATQIDADLIAFMNMNKNNLLGVVSAGSETYLLNNESKIPVLVVNPIEGLFLSKPTYL